MNAIADEWTALADSAADSCRVFPDPAYQPGTELAEQFCMLEQKNAGSEKGADVKNVSAMLGYSSAGFTLATYTHHHRPAPGGGHHGQPCGVGGAIKENGNGFLAPLGMTKLRGGTTLTGAKAKLRRHLIRHGLRPCHYLLYIILCEARNASLAYNLLKLHHKAKTDRLGTGLVMPKQFPAGL